MDYLCISVRFLDQRYHGRGEDGGPEWPPSPLRLMQALVAASAGRWNERRTLQHAAPAIRWLETLPPPQIIAADATPCGQPYRLYVPDNVTDKVAAAWSRGREASIADYRTEKDVLPMVLDGDTVHYVYQVANADGEPFVNVVKQAARSITHLGWGIDIVVGDTSVLTEEQLARLQGVRWRPSPVGGTPLRTPKAGALDELMRKHTDFLSRVDDDGFRPVPPLRVFDIVHYRRDDEPLQRPSRVFELRTTEGDRFRYPHRKFIHITGMVRHLAIEAMKHSPPRGISNATEWVESYVAGHQSADHEERKLTHRQLSYLPLPSVGHPHADPGVRRVMIAAPVGDETLLDHVARRLAGQILKPLRGDEFAGREPPLLVPLPRRGDGVTRHYTQPANVWHSVTPVILPGHDDRKPAKTRRLIKTALAQSGIEQPCEFEWGAFSRFRKSFSAHKYGRDGKPSGYFRPNHLLSQTATHLTIRFLNDLQVPGPLVIGSGRHCGFGLMASLRE